MFIRIINITFFIFLFLSFDISLSYATPTSISELRLTEAEKDVLKRYPVLRMGVGTSFPPFQFVEKSDNHYFFKGIASDMVKLLEKRLNIKMEPVYGISFQEALALGESGDIDLFPAISWTPERQKFLNFTKPYSSYPLVIIGREDSSFISSIEDLAKKNVAVVKHLANYSKLNNDYQYLNINFVFKQNVNEVLTAVSLGDADYLISNLAVASYLINKLGLSNLQVLAPTPWKDNQLSMATRQDEPLLSVIIQKALNGISPSEKQTIVQDWVTLEYDSLLDPWLVYNIFLPIMIFGTLLFFVIAWWNRRLNIEIKLRTVAERQLTQLAHYDHLTKLPNRYLFFDRLNQSIKSAKRQKSHCAVLFIDIDKFKPINDQYGHLEGDLVLKVIAQRLKKYLRESDTVARLGGDEFVVLINELDEVNNASNTREKLILALEEPIHVGSNKHKITASIGVSIYPLHGKTADELIASADEKMYAMKKSTE